MRILSIMLICVLLTGITACSSGDKPSADSGAVTTEAETIVTEEMDLFEMRSLISDDLPNEDFGGAQFVVLARDRQDFVDDIGTELEESGDIFLDSIYARNSAVEERFNVDIVGVFDSNPIPKMRSAVLSGDDTYDIISGHVIEMGSAAIEGHYLDWYEDLPYVNLDKPWYIGNAKDALSIKNHAYIMAGEFNLSILRFTYCMYFNKNLAENYNTGDLYSIVNVGAWTIDRLSAIVKDAHEDINGDNVMDSNDLWGFTSDYYSAAVTYQYAFDHPVMKTGADGIPEINANTPKMISLIEKVYDFFYNNPGSLAENWGVSGPIWNDGRALFLNGLFRDSGSYRDLEFDFGVIPYPKWDEAQSAYYTMADGAHDVMAVPVTVSDVNKTSMIIEALNAESYKQVVPVYYEIALKVKYARDDESVAVLDTILDGRYFDFGYIYDGWQGVAFLIQDCTSGKTADYSSKYAAKENSAIKRYGDVINSLLSLDE